MAWKISELPAMRESSRSAMGGRTYTRVMQVITDDKNVGPKSVLDVLGFKYGDPYVSYNESDPSSYLQDISAREAAEDGRQWNVTLSYGPFDASTVGNGPDGDDPTKAPPEVSGNFRGQTVPIDTDYDGEPILNAAGDPFVDPPLEEDDPRLIVTIVRNEARCPWALIYQYRKAVNSDSFLGSDPGQWRVVQISPVRQWHQDYGFYWKLTYEFEFNEDGWKARPLNCGYREIGSDGNIQRATDKGTPVPHPVLLDEDGKRLPDGADPVYLEFKVKPELPFSVFNFGDDIANGVGGKPGQY